MKHQKWNTFKRELAVAFPHTIPVLTGYMALGIAYGFLMDVNGYGPFWSVLMSLVAFCGSMQYAAVALLTAPFHPLQALVLSLTINARHIFYGLSMLEKYRGFGKSRLFLIFSLSDETYSVASSVLPPEDISPKHFYLWISALNYSYWAIGTLIGGLAGQFIHFDTTGLDFVLTALFVVLFLEQVKTRENLIFGAIGISCAVLGLVVFGASSMVIPSMILILSVLLIQRRVSCS